MARRINRREFVAAGATVGIAAASPTTLFGQAPAVKTSVRPAVVASSNGNRYKNGGAQTCVEKAFSMITRGLPNADGVVQLDASCMHGPRKRAGAVAAIEGVRTPSLVAQAVMDQTDHLLLVGKDAQDFARKMGFKVEEGLIGDRARELWLEWKRRTDPEHYLDPKKRADLGYKTGLDMVREGLIDADSYWGTINCDGINSKGEICGTTTTSGLAWKIPGRVGDSPIVGAGLYVTQDVGAAGSTGRGVVEAMGRGMHPKDAGLEALKRVKANTIEKRLLNSQGNPSFGLSFYVLNAKGEYAGVSMYEGATYAVCTGQRADATRAAASQGRGCARFFAGLRVRPLTWACPW
jgi:N4-(beta-N-acetylglucosaminyl)-L-asparaginase